MARGSVFFVSLVSSAKELSESKPVKEKHKIVAPVIRAPDFGFFAPKRAKTPQAIGGLAVNASQRVLTGGQFFVNQECEDADDQNLQKHNQAIEVGHKANTAQVDGHL